MTHEPNRLELQEREGFFLKRSKTKRNSESFIKPRLKLQSQICLSELESVSQSERVCGNQTGETIKICDYVFQMLRKVFMVGEHSQEKGWNWLGEIRRGVKCGVKRNLKCIYSFAICKWQENIKLWCIVMAAHIGTHAHTLLP